MNVRQTLEARCRSQVARSKLPFFDRSGALRDGGPLVVLLPGVERAKVGEDDGGHLMIVASGARRLGARRRD
jgi:hypothetical protein